MAIGNAVEGTRQDTRAGSDQIDLDEADTTSAKLLLLLEVELPSRSWKLVGGTQDLDHSDDLAVRPGALDIDEPLSHWFIQDAGEDFSPRGFNKLAHVNTGEQTRGQFSLNCCGRMGDHRMMHIAPELLQIRVHAGEWAQHDRALRYRQRIYASVYT